MPEHGHTGDCPECSAPAAGKTCTHCGHRQRSDQPLDEPVEAADLAADALTIGALQDWYARQPPGGGQDTHPDAADEPWAGPITTTARRPR